MRGTRVPALLFTHHGSRITHHASSSLALPYHLIGGAPPCPKLALSRLKSDMLDELVSCEIGPVIVAWLTYGLAECGFHD